MVMMIKNRHYVHSADKSVQGWKVQKTVSLVMENSKDSVLAIKPLKVIRVVKVRLMHVTHIQ